MGSETRPGGGFEHVCWVFRRHLCRMRVGLRNDLGLRYQKWGNSGVGFRSAREKEYLDGPFGKGIMSNLPCT